MRDAIPAGAHARGVACIKPPQPNGALELDATYGLGKGVANLNGFSRKAQLPDDPAQPFYPVLVAVPNSIEVAAFAAYRQSPRLPVRGLAGLLVDGRSRYDFVDGFPLDKRVFEAS